ncbi:hypothetical protein GCM10010365_64900 [Streptomyces poonensis]|uniref:Uncharacterized protein n=1 Tax=Streptomyces poonensis TaxID=68255 RepID=A0A918Q636_9ACTN|nr:hypothetical protein GCM10010365_64900 [Streptomyces poonensis]GLJ89551.1 hypothetical protein GCM10017589_21510 [Streptomyces poonensis]
MEVRDGALRPGRHTCPAALRELFAPLLSLAEQDVVPLDELDQAGQAALGVPFAVEQDWLTRVLTATDTSRAWSGSFVSGVSVCWQVSLGWCDT